MCQVHKIMYKVIDRMFSGVMFVMNVVVMAVGFNVVF